MTSPLTWRDAGQGDRVQLTNFICTAPAKPEFRHGRRTHPRPWELDAQSGVRTLRVPSRDQNKPIIVGVDGGGLAVVCKYEYTFDQAGSSAFINVVAVARRAQAQGYGQQAIDHILSQLFAARVRDKAPHCVVQAKVHTKNEPSKAMCAAKGFSNGGSTGDPGMEYWATVV